jgi:hypothetical protein
MFTSMSYILKTVGQFPHTGAVRFSLPDTSQQAAKDWPLINVHYLPEQMQPQLIRRFVESALPRRSLMIGSSKKIHKSQNN